MYPHMYPFIWPCVYLFVYRSTFIRVCIHMCIYLCIYVCTFAAELEKPGQMSVFLKKPGGNIEKASKSGKIQGIILCWC